MTYGTVNARPPKSVKGRIERPSVQERFLPKKRVSMTTINVGIRMPAVAWSSTAFAVTAPR